MNTHLFAHKLFSLLGLYDSHIITFVGGGGKTSLMNILGEESAKNGTPTLLTTTTHIMKPDFLPSASYIEEENFTSLIKTLTTVLLQQEYPPLIALGIPEKIIGNKIKWKGTSETFCKKVAALSSGNSENPLRIFCEGDGSKRLPVKLPKENEPVFFPETDTVIGVVGLSCLGKPTEKTLFRYELLDKIFSGNDISDKEKKWPDKNFYQNSFAETKTITTDFLYWLCLSEKGLRKNVTTQKFCIILNQADVLDEEALKSVLTLQNNIKKSGIPCYITSVKDGIII